MKLSLVGFAMVVTACNGSKAAPKDEAKGPVKITEATTREPAAKEQPAPKGVAADPSKCGDGKITTIESTLRSDHTVTMYCRDGKPMALFKTEHRGLKLGTGKTAITMDQWNEVWAMADTAAWKSAAPTCKDDPDADFSHTLKIHRDGVTKSGGCSGKWGWDRLASAVVELTSAAEKAAEEAAANAPKKDLNAATTISMQSVGPLERTMPVDLAALAKLFPSGKWTEATLEAEGTPYRVYEHSQNGLRVVPVDGKIKSIVISANGFSTGTGVHVDSTGKELSEAYEGDIACMDASEGGVDCFAYLDDHMNFHLAGPRLNEDGSYPDDLAKHVVDRIDWN